MTAFQLTPTDREKNVTDYTPTTEEVRKGYAGALYLSDVPRDRSEEFDRWLIAERKRVAEMATHKEHERIINVLKETARELDMLQKDDEDEFSNGVIQGILGSIALLQDEDNG